MAQLGIKYIICSLPLENNCLFSISVCSFWSFIACLLTCRSECTLICCCRSLILKQLSCVVQSTHIYLWLLVSSFHEGFISGFLWVESYLQELKLHLIHYEPETSASHVSHIMSRDPWTALPYSSSMGENLVEAWCTSLYTNSKYGKSLSQSLPSLATTFWSIQSYVTRRFQIDWP